MKKLVVFLSVVVALLSGCNGSNTVTVTFASPSQAIDNGQSVNITVTVKDSKNAGVTWTLSGPGALSNQAATSVTYTAAATGGGTATITAASVTDSKKSATLTITVTAPPAITTTTLAAGVEGTAYNATVAVTGGAGKLTYSISVGALPAGLSLNSSTGAITGTPTGPNGAVNFTVKVTDSSAGGPQSATQALSILINLPPPPSITTASLPNATEGTAYSQTITATGGLTPYTFSIVVPGTGTLPAGLTMSTAGVISGTPTGPNTTSNFTVKVTDSSNPTQSATQNLSITVNLPTPPSITTPSPLPSGTEGTAYNQTIAATGGIPPYTFAVTTGALPAGLSMDTSGHVTGTPTGPNGATSFTVTVTDKSNPPQTGSKGLSITINLPAAPTISPTTLPNGNVGSPYSQTLTVSNGLGPFTWVVSSGILPAGLVLTTNNPTTTAKISGTPTTAQNNVAFTVQVTDTSNPPQIGQQAYTVTINPPAPLAITTTSPLPNGAFNTAYSITINASGGIAPYTFSLDAASSPLPAGLNFTNDAANNQGKISGTPTTAGMFTNIIVDVHDSQVPTAATATKTFTLTITAQAIVISPATGSLPNGTQNTAYTTNITATGGVTPYTFSLDATSVALPAGLTFTSNSTTGTISGTPTATGTTNGIIVDVKDSESPAVTQKVTYSITISSSGTLTCPLPLSGSESLLSAATYAAQFNGWNDTKGMFQATASFTSDGAGSIPNGVVDSNGVGSTPQNLIMTAGCYNLGSDHRGKMIWNLGAGNTVTFSFVMRADGKNGDLIEFDDTTGTSKTRGSGSIRLQDTTLFVATTLSGPWAFGDRGVKGDGTRAGSLGAFTLGGASLTLTGGAVDYSEPGTSFTGLTATGSFTAPDATHGRGTLTIAIANVPGIGTLTLHFAYYITRGAGGAQPIVYIQSTDTPDTLGHALLNGIMTKQVGQVSGSYSNGSLNGTVIFALTGDDTSHPIPDTTNTIVGIATSTGNGLFTGFGDQEADAASLVNQQISGTISIGANGLGTVHITAPVAQVPTSIVMVAPNTALMLEGTAAQAGNDTQTGLLQPQSAGSFSTASLSGTLIFGSDEPAKTAVAVDVGTIAITSPGVFTITEDSSDTSGLHPDQVITGTYTMTANGRGDIAITGGGTAVIWMLGPNKAVVMPRGGGAIALLNLEQ